MPNGKKQTGNLGEDLAARYLKKLGYKILKRNLKNYLGEIDILAEAPLKHSRHPGLACPEPGRGDPGSSLDSGSGAGMTSKVSSFFKRKNRAIVVVEVKTKSGSEFGEGFEMVNYFKQKKLLSLAKQLQTDYPDRTIRIDVVSVDTSQDPPEIKHFVSAVEE